MYCPFSMLNKNASLVIYDTGFWTISSDKIDQLSNAAPLALTGCAVPVAFSVEDILCPAHRQLHEKKALTFLTMLIFFTWVLHSSFLIKCFLESDI